MTGLAKALENADSRIEKEIHSHKIKVYSYVDDFNYTTEYSIPARPHSGRQQEAITAARKVRGIVSQELEKCSWSRDL